MGEDAIDIVTDRALNLQVRAINLANDTTLPDHWIQEIPDPLKAVVEATSSWSLLAEISLAFNRLGLVD